MSVSDAAPARVRNGSGSPAPAYDWGERAAISSWREGAATRAHELEALARWLTGVPGAYPDESLVTALFAHLGVARDAATARGGILRSVSGSSNERAASNIDAAESTLLRIAPDWYLRGQMPSLLRHVERHLPAPDRRLGQLQLLAEKEGPLDDTHRSTVVAAHRAASSEATREHARVRSFRNVLVVTSFVLVMLAAGVAALGALNPKAVPLCFEPELEGRIVVVCPTEQSEFIAPPPPGQGPSSPDVDDVVRSTASAQDLFTVELVGLLAASIAAAAGLRGIRGSSTPFGLPVALAILKLPTGALTAFLGLLLMRGGFVPGLSALDTSAQVLAWAIVFGYAQQVFTRLVDQQAHTVLDAVGGAERRSVAAGAE
jgi:hypothetical protein